MCAKKVLNSCSNIFSVLLASVFSEGFIFFYKVLIVALKRMVCNGTKGVALDGPFMMDHFPPPKPSCV